MASEGGFVLGLGARVATLTGALLALVWTIQTPGLAAARLIAALGSGAALWALWSYVRRTDIEVARFVDAVRHRDLSASFRSQGGFQLLGVALEEAMRALRAERAAAAEEGRFLRALVDDMPVPLLLLQNSRVELANRAARRLFGELDGVRPDDFAPFGAELADALRARFRGRKIVPVLIDKRLQRTMLLGSELQRLSTPAHVFLLQPIQGELDGVAIAAEADLVRVLTHEIMNSMTPVTSLAASAAAIMAEVDRGQEPAIADARLAVDTLARRAAGIMRFVESYRDFSRVPEPHRRRFPASDWMKEIARLFRATDAGRLGQLSIEAAEPKLMIDADPDLLSQAVLNLLKNGAEAAAGLGIDPELALDATSAGDGSVLISVTDNGPGIAPNVAEDMFLPFFTTKAGGTGIGLFLTRRIVQAHGGELEAVTRPTGACFRLRI